MIETPLVDEVARRSIATELDSTLFVEAGAGSGKTRELVGRIVALVSSGRARISEIAAVTFTEAAAAELRLRVREELERRLSSPALGREGAERCKEALACIDQAPISTIHGFCRRILAAHPIEAGLPPRFDVLDEITESIGWRESWSRELDLLGEDEDLARLVALAWDLGVSDRHLERLARALYDKWHLYGGEPLDLRGELEAIERSVRAGVGQLRAAVKVALGERTRCLDADDKLLGRLFELAEVDERLELAQWHEALRVIKGAVPASPPTTGQSGSWGGDVEAVRALVADVVAARNEVLALLSDQVFGALTAYFGRRSYLVAADRRRRGSLCFHDLLVICRDLLRDDRGVLADVKRRFSHILIDEFQDTDLLQLEIARLIGSASERFEEGRCFFVGDPKQSIYRFRGADLAAYEAARREIVGEASTLLVSNFRSVPGVISFVNASFEGLLGERFQSLDAARAPLGGGVLGDGSCEEKAPVCVIGGELADAPSKSAQRAIESEDCCRAIERAVFDEAWEVFDEALSASRPARLSDVAILVPRRTGLDQLEAALDEHAIGYRVESASLIFKSQEVRDVLHLARALAEPGDEGALVATLRSPAYSIGDDELVAWAAAGGPWSTEERAGDCAVSKAPRVAAAIEDLARLRSEMGALGPAGTLSRAVADRRLYQLAADGPRWRESWRRLRYILDRARAFVEAGGGGLGELADWVDEQIRGGLRSTESVVPEADEDVVRIMTVHGAKGLEFPITIMCGFGTSADTSPSYDTCLRGADGKVEVRFSKEAETSGYAALHQADRQLGEAEAIRLCYVAATRARDHLVICGHHVQARNGERSLVQALLEEAAAAGAKWRQLPSVTEKDPSVAVPPRQPAAEPPLGQSEQGELSPRVVSIESVEQYEKWREGRAELLAKASRQANVRATEVGALKAARGLEEAGASYLELDDANSATGVLGHARRRGRAGTRIGRAVHATLQSVRMKDAVALAETAGGDALRDGFLAAARRRLSEVAHAQARAERLDEEGDEVARLAAAALSSPTVRLGILSGTARRETYVAASEAGSVIDGYIDLCFVEADGSFTVVDYKTDAVRSPAEAAKRAASYELQAASYALALEKATGGRVGRCVLVFLAPPSFPVEHEISDSVLKERLAEVRAIVSSLAP